MWPDFKSALLTAVTLNDMSVHLSMTQAPIVALQINPRVLNVRATPTLGPLSHIELTQGLFRKDRRGHGQVG